MFFFTDWRRLCRDQMREPWVVTYDAKNECSETCMRLISQSQVEARCIVRAFKQYMYIDTAHKKSSETDRSTVQLCPGSARQDF